ncbi:MAG: hypothetical protein IJI58_04180 [Bacilli bacterium]|nr:hypothetical protein [Bacilli bacterium]
MYYIQKNINKLKTTGSTFFLDPKELMEIKGKLKKNEYNIYYPYKDSEKVILYKNNEPEVILYEIKIKVPVRHQDILGSIYSLGIDKELFGDILIIDNHYYVYILPLVRNYFETNFLMVRKSHITLEELDINTLKDYERSYEKQEYIVSSNRIDTIISSICHINRSSISDMIKKREILLNHDYLKNSSYKLKDNDTFSIKRIGKFKYNGIIKNTKSDHLIIEILKYL